MAIESFLFTFAGGGALGFAAGFSIKRIIKITLIILGAFVLVIVRVSAKPSILKHPRIRWMLYWSLMVIIGYFVSMYIFRIMLLHHQ
jgi:hypothetical protein